MYGYPVGGMDFGGYPLSGMGGYPMGGMGGYPLSGMQPMVSPLSVPAPLMTPSPLSLWNIAPSMNSWVNAGIQCSFALNPLLQNNWWWPLVQSVNPTQFNNVHMWFLSADADRSGTIEINELMMGQFPGGIRLSPRTALRLMRIFDTDCSGRISFYEYMGMYKFLELCFNVFVRCDTNRTGTMEPHEIISALGMLGFFVSQRTAVLLHRIFANGMIFCDMNCWIAICAFAAQTRTAYQVITTNPFYGVSQPFNPMEFGKFLDVITSLLE